MNLVNPPATDRSSVDAVHIEVVDHRHPRWEQAVQSFFCSGNRPHLHLDQDGCLSARQSVLLARIADQVVGHLCMQVNPSRIDGVPRLLARVDCVWIEPGRGIELQRCLLAAAELRARTMQCAALTHALVERAAV